MVPIAIETKVPCPNLERRNVQAILPLGKNGLN